MAQNISVGTSTVTDYVNTTMADAEGVVALGGVGGSGLVAFPVLPSTSFLVTDSGDNIVTDSGLFLITG